MSWAPFLHSCHRAVKWLLLKIAPGLFPQLSTISSTVLTMKLFKTLRLKANGDKPRCHTLVLNDNFWCYSWSLFISCWCIFSVSEHLSDSSQFSLLCISKQLSPSCTRCCFPRNSTPCPLLNSSTGFTLTLIQLTPINISWGVLPSWSDQFSSISRGN